MNGFGFLGHDGEWRDSEAGDFDRLLHRDLGLDILGRHDLRA